MNSNYVARNRIQDFLVEGEDSPYFLQVHTRPDCNRGQHHVRSGSRSGSKGLLYPSLHNVFRPLCLNGDVGVGVETILG